MKGVNKYVEKLLNVVIIEIIHQLTKKDKFF